MRKVRWHAPDTCWDLGGLRVGVAARNGWKIWQHPAEAYHFKWAGNNGKEVSREGRKSIEVEKQSGEKLRGWERKG